MKRLVWHSSARQLLKVEEGTLRVTPDFIRAYLNRPELAPVEESCQAERTLHKRLLDDPMTDLDKAALSSLADEDARENYQVFERFRAHLLKYQTVEAAYLAIVRSGSNRFPSLFLDHMIHALMEFILEGSDDPFRFRAAELFFRSQTVTFLDGVVLMADEEIVEMKASQGPEADVLGQLLADPKGLERNVEIDVLRDETKGSYWARADRFDTAIDFRFTQPAMDAYARCLEAFIKHMLGLTVSVEPLPAIRDERWAWHVGLDAMGTKLLNKLFQEEVLTEEEEPLILGLFKMTIEDVAAVLPRVAGRPVYLGLAMSPERKVVMKPQNLLVNLPLNQSV